MLIFLLFNTKRNQIKTVSDWLRRIICRTSGLTSSGTGDSGTIKVSIGDDTITWPQLFVYKVS